ncbi:MAG TPA: HlyD family type I secretion periplasmic adaptor subunit, partial [Pseudomonas sp.]|nr:HlyD family type I secretion periplasmic adaptor subunit [Pseudomonas sp.]
MSNLEFERKSLIPYPGEQDTTLDLDDRRPGRWGVWLVVAGFGGFLLWASLA